MKVRKPGFNMKDLSAGTNQELLAENAALRRRITELEQAGSTYLRTDDAARRELNERLSLALEVGNAGIWEWDLKRDEVRLDDRFHATLGYAPGELPTTLQEWLPYHHPEDVPIWMAKAEAYFLYDNTTADACSRLFREKSFQLE
jgi:PAS domain-containing protein